MLFCGGDPDLDDDYYDLYDDLPAREEPDCPPCGDRQAVPARLKMLARAGRTRQCPNCCGPTRTDRVLATLSMRRWRRRFNQARYRDTFSDEAPF